MRIRREVKIGIFATITLAALYWGVNFLKGRDLFSTNNSYYAQYDQVNGIQRQSAIVIKGFKVGVISDISYDPRLSDKVVLEFSIKSGYPIPDNSLARIYSDGLLGGRAIEIVLGDSDRYLEDGDTLRSDTDRGFLELAGSELEFLKQQVGTLVSDLSETLGNVNTILTANQQALATTMNNLTEISGNINQVIGGDSGSIKSLVADLNSLSGTLSRNAQNIDNIVGNVESFTGTLAQAGVGDLIDNLSSSLQKLDLTLAGINSGEGTVGKLLNDDELYDSLISASANLSRLLEDLKANPSRYINVSVFGRRSR